MVEDEQAPDPAEANEAVPTRREGPEQKPAAAAAPEPNRIEAPDSSESVSAVRQVAEFVEAVAEAVPTPVDPTPSLLSRFRELIGSGGADADAAVASGDSIPQALRTRYALHVSDDGKTIALFENGAKTPAITLDAQSITTPHNAGAVIADVVALARDRGWQTLKIAGTPEFKDAIWLEATKAGLSVQHAPSAAIQAHYDKWAQERPSNRVQEAPSSQAGGAASNRGEELSAAFVAKTSDERLADPRLRNAQLELMVGVRTAEKELGRPIAEMPDVMQALTGAIRQQLAHGRVFDAPFVRPEPQRAAPKQVINPKIEADRIPPPRQ